MENKVRNYSPESLRLIGAALALQQATRSAANIVPLPNTGRFVLIGTPAEVARLLQIGPSADALEEVATCAAVDGVEHDHSEGRHHD